MDAALAQANAQLRETTQQLAEFKSRALRAEADLSETTSNNQRVSQLESELKEKTTLIGKLRHDSESNELVHALLKALTPPRFNLIDRRHRERASDRGTTAAAEERIRRERGSQTHHQRPAFLP